MREWLGALLLRTGLRIVSDRHAWLFYKLQRMYWYETPEGKALRRQFGDDDDFTNAEIERVIANAEASGEVVWPEQDGESR